MSTIKRRRRLDFQSRAAFQIRWLPHAYIMPKDPFFGYEARVLHWGRTAAEVLAFATKRWIAALVLGIAFWVIFAPGMDDSTVAEIGVLLFLLSQSDRLFLDFPAAQIALHSLHNDFKSQRWESIVVTDVDLNGVIRAKFAVIQIMMWRQVIYAVGLRIFFVMWLLLSIGADISAFLPIFNGLGALSGVASVLTLLVGGFLYCIMPIYRLRLLVAAGLRESTKTKYPLIDSLSVISSAWSVPLFMVSVIICSMLFFIAYELVFALPVLICVALYLAMGLYRHEARMSLEKTYKRLNQTLE